MVLNQSAQILLAARRDPQDPVRRILKDAGYALISVDSASSVVRTAQRSHPALIVVETGALSAGVAESLVSFADANCIPVVRDWPGAESLLAEVERVLGKPEPAGRDSPQIVVGPLCLDLAGHVAVVACVPLDLTAREFELLCHLARHPGWVYSRQELLEQVWGYEYGDPRVVTVHMANLRKKLGAASPGCELIETVRNVGYKLVVPSQGNERSPSPETEAPAPGASGADPKSSAPGQAEGPPTPAHLAHPADERRLVTVLFAHMGGLGVLAENLDFASLHDLADTLFGRLAPCVERYGGQIERRSPDSIVALFGAAVAHDNDAEMAVRAAIDMRETVAVFAADSQGDALSLHVGIETGIVIAGARGEGSDLYAVVGVPIDTASCLADIAGGSDILVGPEAFRLTAPILAWEPAGRVKVRGRPEEASCHRVLSIEQARTARDARRRIESDLVGRDEQMVTFRGCLDRLDQGLGSVIFVVGEAGVGKSRLMAEVRKAAAGRESRWLEARTLSYGQNISYWPIREVINSDCGISPEDPPAEREGKLEMRVRRLFADKAEEILPVLSGLLGVARGDRGDGEPFPLEEERVRKTLIAGTARYLSRVCTEQPLVLVFEDVHWLDGSSAVLVENLLPLTANAPLVICLVGRGESGSFTLELQDAARRHEGLACVNIELARLSKKQTHLLLRNLLGGSELDPHVVRTIESRSEGNPFFIEEIVRHFIDTGVLYSNERGIWAVTESGDLAIPATIQGVIAARIDRLPEGARHDILQASVIGRSFPRRLLRALSHAGEDELDRNLSSLQEHQLIFVKREEPEIEYAFKHALVQDAAYGSLLLRQRRQLHSRAARAIRELYADHLEELYGILAYHYTRAEDWQNAQTFLLRAGEQAVSIAADGEAITYYREAMSALLRAFDESTELPASHEQSEWFVRATEPFWLARCLGDLLEAASVFHERVSQACGPLDPRTSAAAAILAGCFFQRGVLEACETLVKTTLAALEAAGREDDPSVTRLLLLLGLVCLNTDRFTEAEEILARGLELEDSKASPSPGVLQDF